MQQTELAAWAPADAEWVLIMRPAALDASPDMRELAETIFGARRLEAWRTSVVLDPAGTTPVAGLRLLVVAKYADGILVLTPRPGSVDTPAGQREGARLVRGGVVVLRGIGEPRAYETIARAQVASDVPPEHADPELVLLASTVDAPLALCFPRPLSLPPNSDVGLLMSRQQSLAIALDAPREDRHTVRVHLRGEFPAGAAANLRRLVLALAADPLGRAFGGPTALSELHIVPQDGGITVAFRIDAAAFSRGIGLLFGDVRANLLANQ